MTASATLRCPACGVAAPGANFCNACGAPLGAQACPACGAEVRADSRFCGQCGTLARGAPPGIAARRRPLLAMAVGGAALLGIVLVVLARKDAGQAPASADATLAAEPPAGTPPDISAMSPRERFDRLYNRIMKAAESGDEATVTRFTPMALMAYAQLPEVDADARYHAALLKVHTGDAAGALALADTILANTPGHLFGYVVRGTVARWRQDDKALAAAYAGFLSHYEAEMKAGRTEYGDHTRALDEFRQATQAAKAAAKAEKPAATK